MALYDRDGRLRAQWEAPARLEIASDPPGAQVSVRRYAADFTLGEPQPLGATPLADVTLPPGSLVLELTSPGRPPVTYPLLAGRDERISITVPLPTNIPDGFAYVPPGRTLVGSGDDESVRAFFKAIPQHPVTTPGYLIARHETTFADWLAFLDDLPPAERAKHTPSAGSAGAQGGIVALTRGASGWELAMQPGSTLLRAVAGATVRYPERTTLAEQDWLRMPVMGISFDDALAYAAWAARTGRVPGARLCTEAEWERAARGADGRAFPHGDVLAPTDANVDETYGKNPASFGPDEVGRHPNSRSPFGVDDLAGNVWELVATDATPAQPVARGGSFYFAATTARIANRETPDRTYRDISVGMRLCASAP
jgi:formylglycine-generating enzyme required for sulfatase activity